jgi:hypothetical protein
MGKQGFARIHRFSGIFRLCMCLVLVGIIISGAAAPAAAASAGGSLPVIKMFIGDPPIVPDGGHVKYKFEVYDGTKIQIWENGVILNEYSGPPGTMSRGETSGMTTYQIRSGPRDTFEAMLIASNAGGIQKKTLTLTFATKSKPKPPSLIPPVSADRTGNKNRWGPPTSAPVSLTSSAGPAMLPEASVVPAPNDPDFFKCPSDCDHCLTPDEAAGQGLTKKCSEKPCYFSPNKDKNWYCYSAAKGWCCKDGKVTPASEAECKEKGGFYWSTDQGQVIKACQPEVGWFCSGNKVYQGTSSQAAQAGVTLYATEVEATKACEQMCWCCAGGRYGQTTKDACDKMYGTCFATQAQASEGCLPLGWFCSGNKVYPGTSTQAAQAGVPWYATEAEATKACEQQCWCCTSGRYGQTTADACAKTYGTCYPTQAKAKELCQPLGGCCVNGQFTTATSAECAAIKGVYYTDPVVGKERCQPPLGYGCINGRVTGPMTEAQAKQGGATYWSTSQAQVLERCQPITYYCCGNGQVYKSPTLGPGCSTSLTEAQRACTPPPTPTYWCCGNGQVYQSKTLGRGCYATQAEAIKACTPIPTPIAPTPRTFVPNVK